MATTRSRSRSTKAASESSEEPHPDTEQDAGASDTAKEHSMSFDTLFATAGTTEEMRPSRTVERKYERHEIPDSAIKVVQQHAPHDMGGTGGRWVVGVSGEQEFHAIKGMLQAASDHCTPPMSVTCKPRYSDDEKTTITHLTMTVGKRRGAKLKKNAQASTSESTESTESTDGTEGTDATSE